MFKAFTYSNRSDIQFHEFHFDRQVSEVTKKNQKKHPPDFPKTVSCRGRHITPDIAGWQFPAFITGQMSL